MSFYFEAAAAAASSPPPPSSRHSSQTSKNTGRPSIYTTSQESEAFCCDACGGLESYRDEASGALICVSCFTQSQTGLTQEEIDYDDAMALAGRVSGRLSAMAGPKQKRKRKRLQDYDRTVPLPQTQECLQGLLRVLHGAVRQVTKLMQQEKDESSQENKNNGNDEKKERLAIARDIWEAYMWAWMEGADYFSRIYPEVRFCFRDYFLSANLHTKLLKNLASRIGKQVRKEWKQEKKLRRQQKRPRRQSKEPTESEIDTDDDGDDDGDGPPLKSVVPKEDNQDSDYADDEASQDTLMPEDKGKRIRSVNPIQKLLKHHYKQHLNQKLMGRKGAALSLPPSMTLVIAILCLTFEPCGIGYWDILNWIHNGSLPLVDAFGSFLTPKEQKELAIVQGFFQMTQLPSTATIRTAMATLQTACGYAKPKIVVKKKDGSVVQSHASLTLVPGRLRSPKTVPLVLVRLIAQLGLSQRVLDYSLALMGLPVTSTKESKDDKLPLPLNACRCDKVMEVSRLLAVILIACTQIPGWEKHWLERPSWRQVPWTTESLNRLTDDQVEGYLDFLEQNIVAPEHAFLYSQDTATRTSRTESQASDPQVLPCDIVAQGRSSQGVTCVPSIAPPQLSSSDLYSPLLEVMAHHVDTDPGEILEYAHTIRNEMTLRQAKRLRRITLPLEEAYARGLS